MTSPTKISGLAETLTLLSQPYAGEDLGLADCPVLLVEPTPADLALRPPAGLAELIRSTPAVTVVAVPEGMHPSEGAGPPEGEGPSEGAGSPEGTGPSEGIGPPEGAASAGAFGGSGPAELWGLFDVVLAPDDLVDLVGPQAVSAHELDRIVAAVAVSPDAAVALAQLLRLGEGLSTADGLVAESLAYSTLQSGPRFRSWLADRPRRAVPPNPAPAVVAERTSSTLRLTLNRPERHNAFSAEMRDGLVEQLRAAWADPSLDGIVLDGAGPTFCSGGDLAEFGTTPDPGTAHRVRSVRSAAFWLDRLAARTRVMVHGTCVGAGVELPAYAHDVVAHPRTTFRLPEVAMGLVPGAGGTVSLARRIGRHRLCYFALTNTEITAPTALSWGLIDRIGPTPIDKPIGPT